MKAVVEHDVLSEKQKKKEIRIDYIPMKRSLEAVHIEAKKSAVAAAAARVKYHFLYC